MSELIELIRRVFESANKSASDEICPVCGYYCLGKGGIGCIDKPKLVEIEKGQP
jgi:hypothetical protein